MTIATTSAPQGAAPDASAGSSTATSTASTTVAQPTAPQSTRERMLAQVSASNQAPASSSVASPAAADVKTGDSPASSPGKADDAQQGEQRSDENTDSKKKQPDSIPLAVFKGRIAEEKAKRDTALAEVATLKLTKMRYEKGIELLEYENARLKSQLREGRAFNETEEQLAETQLDIKAREAHEKLSEAHKTQLKQEQDAAALEERRLELRNEFQTKISQAVEKYPLVTAEEVMHHMMQDRKSKPSSASEVARLVSEYKQKQLEKLGYARAPSTPSVQNPLTVSAPNGGANLGRTGTGRAAMLDFAQSQLGHR